MLIWPTWLCHSKCITMLILYQFTETKDDNKKSQKLNYCKGCCCCCCWWRFCVCGWAEVCAGDIDADELVVVTLWTCNWWTCNCAASSAKNEHLEHCLLLWTFNTWVAKRSALAALYSQSVHAKGFKCVFKCRFKHQLSTPLQEQ